MKPAVKLDEFVRFQLELQDKIRSAAYTLRRMPNSDLKYLHAADRCCWPAFVRDWHHYSSDGSPRLKVHPTPEAIDNMELMIGHIAWLATQSEMEARAVWTCFGLGHKSKKAAAMIGCSKDTVIRHRKAGLVRLTHHILGITRKAA